MSCEYLDALLADCHDTLGELVFAAQDRRSSREVGDPEVCSPELGQRRPGRNSEFV